MRWEKYSGVVRYAQTPFRCSGLHTRFHPHKPAKPLPPAATPNRLPEYHIAGYKRSGKNKVVIYAVGEIQRSCPLSAESGTGYREGIYSEYASTIYALTAAIDTKDHYTFSHSKNVAVYAASFARICLLIRSAGNHSVKGVSNAKNPCGKGDVLPPNMPRIPFARIHKREIF